jgi:hypothetical protein
MTLPLVILSGALLLLGIFPQGLVQVVSCLAALA